MPSGEADTAARSSQRSRWTRWASAVSTWDPSGVDLLRRSAPRAGLDPRAVPAQHLFRGRRGDEDGVLAGVVAHRPDAPDAAGEGAEARADLDAVVVQEFGAHGVPSTPRGSPRPRRCASCARRRRTPPGPGPGRRPARPRRGAGAGRSSSRSPPRAGGGRTRARRTASSWPRCGGSGASRPSSPGPSRGRSSSSGCARARGRVLVVGPQPGLDAATAVDDGHGPRRQGQRRTAGGPPRHFCSPAVVASISHPSISKALPPNEAVQST